MANFAVVRNNVIENVIVVSEDDADEFQRSGALGDGSTLHNVENVSPQPTMGWTLNQNGTWTPPEDVDLPAPQDAPASPAEAPTDPQNDQPQDDAAQPFDVDADDKEA